MCYVQTLHSKVWSQTQYMKPSNAVHLLDSMHVHSLRAYTQLFVNMYIATCSTRSFTDSIGQ